MARDPGSVWKPLPEAGAPDGHTKTQFIVHSTGSMASAAANWAYFARENVVVESTFIVGWGPDDPTLQIMDSTDNADANGSANRRGISVEVVGDGIGPYNDWQISELIRLGLWAHQTHGIELRIIPSEPAGGYGWHVMFGAPGPWTTVRSKVCPGGARIQQLKTTVFPAIFAGTDPGGFLMALTDQQQSELYTAVMNLQGYVWKGGPSVNAGLGDPGTVFGRVMRLDRVLTGAQGTPGSLLEKVDALDDGEDPATLAQALAAAIPAEIAQQVVDALAAKLSARPTVS